LGTSKRQREDKKWKGVVTYPKRYISQGQGRFLVFAVEVQGAGGDSRDFAKKPRFVWESKVFG
jgi:hypothetical protein